MHLNKYLKMLVQDNNRFVAVCEEFMKSRVLGPKAGFHRRVTRIVTPGTLIDEPFLNQYENNFLLSIYARPVSEIQQDSKDSLGLAWIDVSTGEFFAKNVSIGVLRDELVRISPREIVLEQAIFNDPLHPVRQVVAEEEYFASSVSFPSASDENAVFAEQVGSDDLTSQMEDAAPTFQIALSNEESRAVQLLTAFLHANLLEHMPRLSSPSREAATDRMQIDAHTIKSLELREGIREGGTAGSLLSVIKRTVTNGGTRLLSRWICKSETLCPTISDRLSGSPSISIAEIESRQSLVAFFISRPHLRQDLSELLSELEDSTRIVQKLLLGRGDPTDLTAISTSVNVWNSIKRRVELEKKMESQERGSISVDEWTSLDILLAKLHDLGDLSSRIDAALSRSGTASQPLSSESDEGPEEPPVDEAFPAVSNLKGFLTGFNWTVRPEYGVQLVSL